MANPVKTIDILKSIFKHSKKYLKNPKSRYTLIIGIALVLVLLCVPSVCDTFGIEGSIRDFIPVFAHRVILAELIVIASLITIFIFERKSWIKITAEGYDFSDLRAKAPFGNYDSIHRNREAA